MCSEILIVSYWVVDHADRMLALVAIVIAAFAIWDVHKLFTELEKRDKDTESRVRKAVLKELLTFTASVATYSRAAQFIEFYEGQPDRETAVAMLVAFKIQQLISPDGTKEQFSELRKTTRRQLEEAARGYAETIISSGLGKLKDGWNFAKPEPEQI